MTDRWLVVEVALTARETEVFGRIRRSCVSSPDGTVAAQMIGSVRACRSLVSKGLIVEEAQSVGRPGGVSHRYRLGGPVGPDGCAVEPVGSSPLTAGYPHGVNGSYTNHGCRCPLCTDAHALAVAGYRAVRSRRSGQPGGALGVAAGGELAVRPLPADTSPGPGLRRPLTQARARERLERLLDGAERVFVDVGFEAATTTMIAAEGETSVGSIYHFFTDKQGIAAALTARYVTALRTALDDGGGVALGGIVDSVAQVAERHPGLGPLLQRSSRSDPDDLSVEVDTVLTDHLDRLLAVPPGPLGEARRRTVARMCTSLLRCLFEMLSAQRSDQRAVVVAETRLALTAYATIALPAGDPTQSAVATSGGQSSAGGSRDVSTQHQGPGRGEHRSGESR